MVFKEAQIADGAYFILKGSMAVVLRKNTDNLYGNHTIESEGEITTEKTEGSETERKRRSISIGKIPEQNKPNQKLETIKEQKSPKGAKDPNASLLKFMISKYGNKIGELQRTKTTKFIQVNAFIPLELLF